MKTEAEMTKTEHREYLRVLEQKYGKSVTVEQLKDSYYECQKLAIDIGDLLKKSMKMNEELLESNKKYKKTIKNC